MTAERIPARGLAMLRDACRRALAFYYRAARPKTQRELDREIDAIGVQLRLAMNAAPDVHSFDEVAVLILQTPHVVDAICQHTFTADEIRAARSPGSDAWLTRKPYRDTYRLFVRVDAPQRPEAPRFTESEGPDLLAVVRTVFSTLGLPLPKEFPKS